MSRVLTLGFELNSLAFGMEVWTPSGGAGTGSIQTGTVRSGAYAYRNNPSSSIQVWPIKISLDTMQTGVAITTLGTHKMRMTAIWAMVDYTPGTGGTWKTSMGLSASSVKTVNSLARASIKTNDGLTLP